MTSVCLVLAYLATSGLNAGEASFDRGPYHGGVVDTVVAGKDAPDPDDVVADARLRRALRAGQKVGDIDCSVAFTQGGVRTIGKPEDERPESVAKIAFKPVVLSKNLRTALVAWRYYYHPLNGGGHYAVMRKVAGGWIVVDHGRYGPIS